MLSVMLRLEQRALVKFCLQHGSNTNCQPQIQVIWLAFPVLDHYRSVTINYHFYRWLSSRHYAVTTAVPVEKPPVHLQRASRGPSEPIVLELESGKFSAGKICP
jgi:hypothetical protein